MPTTGKVIVQGASTTSRAAMCGGVGRHGEIRLADHKSTRMDMWWWGKGSLVRPEEAGLVGLIRRVRVGKIPTYDHDLQHKAD